MTSCAALVPESGKVKAEAILPQSASETPVARAVSYQLLVTQPSNSPMMLRGGAPPSAPRAAHALQGCRASGAEAFQARHGMRAGCERRRRDGLVGRFRRLRTVDKLQLLVLVPRWELCFVLETRSVWRDRATPSLFVRSDSTATGDSYLRVTGVVPWLWEGAGPAVGDRILEVGDRAARSRSHRLRGGGRPPGGARTAGSSGLRAERHAPRGSAVRPLVSNGMAEPDRVAAAGLFPGV
jgi:hypothetical protein